MSPRNGSLQWCMLVWITVAARLAQCSKIAAFMYAPIGTQVFVANTTTGEINYSLCNSNGTPIYPTDPPKVLHTISKPKNGTSIAAVGWYYENTWADVMYQDEQSSLVAVRYKCDMMTGEYSANTDNFPNDPLADPKAPKPHASTGLAGVILSSTDGERWLYHDTSSKLQAVRFMNYGGVGQWVYEGPVSPDRLPGFGIGLAMTPTNQNVTAVFPKDDSDIEISTYNADLSWHISTFPSTLVNASNTTWTSNYNTTLPVNSPDPNNITLTGWTGNSNSLGFVIDTSLARSVFYMDSDSTLNWATSNTKSPWALTGANYSSNGTWPAADEPYADFATASNPQSWDIRIYYMSQGRLSQVSRSSQYGWDAAVALDPVNTTVPAPTTTPSNGTIPAAPSNSGLSTGASAGIGVGVGIVGIALIGLGVCFFLRRRNRSRRAQDASQADAANAAAAQMGPHHFDSAHNSQQYGQQQLYDQGGAPYYYQGNDKNPDMMMMQQHHDAAPIGELGTMYEQSHELPAVGAEPKQHGVHYIPSDGHASPTPAYTGTTQQGTLDPNMAHAVSYGHHSGEHDGQYLDEAGSYVSHTQPASPSLSHGQVSPAPRYSSLSYHSNNNNNNNGNHNSNIDSVGGSPLQDYGGEELHIYSDQGSPGSDAAQRPPPQHHLHQGW